MTVAIVAAALAVLAGSALYLGILLVLRAWLEHRLQRQVLDLLRTDPTLLDSPQRLHAAVAELSRAIPRSGGLFTPLTGALVVTIGAVASLWGYSARVGQLAVGLYVGGQICVAFGVVLIAVGLLLRMVERRGRLRLPV